jgi:hypothetical protein
LGHTPHLHQPVTRAAQQHLQQQTHADCTAAQ